LGFWNDIWFWYSLYPTLGFVKRSKYFLKNVGGGKNH